MLPPAARKGGFLFWPRFATNWRMKISLCMIVGNEAGIIERCLQSACGAFDELCLVRAVGSAAPDATVDLARAWCDRSGKGFRFAEYRNARPGLAHVDHFGAARNVSFSLAAGDWILWLDADDLVDDEQMRAAVEVSDADCLVCTYRMPTGAEYPRERVIRNGRGVWSKPVHETCVIESGIVEARPEIVITHAPTPSIEKQRRSAARNLAILEGLVRDLPRHWYYYHEELYLLSRPEATAAGIAALKILPADMPVERYEVMLNLASLDPQRDLQWIWQATQLDPMRREAWAYLVQHYLAKKDGARAGVFLETLLRIPTPIPPPWTHRSMWYGWGARYLRVLVLRSQGKVAEAETAHALNMQDPEYRSGADWYSSTAQVTS